MVLNPTYKMLQMSKSKMFGRQKGWFECGVCWIILFNGHAISAVTLTRSSRSRWSSSSSTRSSSSSTWSSSWPQWPGHLPHHTNKIIVSKMTRMTDTKLFIKIILGGKMWLWMVDFFPYQELLKRWLSSQMGMIRSISFSAEKIKCVLSCIVLFSFDSLYL